MAQNNGNASPQSPLSPVSLRSPNECPPGLEVSPVSHGPILVPDTPDAIVHHGNWPEAMQIDLGSRSTGENGLILQPTGESGLIPQEKEKEKRPSSRKNLYIWIAVAITLVLIGAIVGGAVGGTQAARNKKGSPSESSVAQPENEAPTSSSSPANMSSSSRTEDIAPSSPSATSLMTFKLQTWSDTNFEGRSQFFYRPGGYHSPWKVLSYTWQPNTPGEVEDPNKLRCAVLFCRDSEFFGWWGRSSREVEDTRSVNDTETREPFNVISIVCDRDWYDLEGSCPEKEALSTFITIPVLEAPTDTISQTVSSSTISTTLASVTSRSD